MVDLINEWTKTNMSEYRKKKVKLVIIYRLNEQA